MQDQIMAPSQNAGMVYGGITAQGIANEYVHDNKIRQIVIQQLNHGYMINVGCQTFAIEKPSDLISKLSEYINAPAETEKKWQEGKLF